MLNISEPESKQTIPEAFLNLAFRPFFLLGAFFSMFAIGIWASVFTGQISIKFYGGAYWWHMHEMLYGFSAAIIVGFLLTAVQNWTNVRSLNGKSLMLLVLLWLLARITMLLPAALPYWLIAVIDLSFLPVAAVALARPIIAVKLWRNLIFIPILLVMALSNLVMHFSMLINDPLLSNQAATMMVLLVTLVMTIMGGRVFPMFTANGTRTPRVQPINWIEQFALFSTLLAILVGFKIFILSPILTGLIFITAAIAQSIRVFRWKIWVTFKTPLVWSLHLSYWCIPLGFLMFALSELGFAVTHSQALHTLTVGAMANMILSMISRVSLGHTGRKIVVGKTMTIAFVLMFFAFIFRVFSTYLIDYTQVILISAALWLLAYGCFVVLYTPILTRPRVDNS